MIRRLWQSVVRSLGISSDQDGDRDPHADKRIAALEGLLGKSEPAVRHAIIPLFMGGSPDYLIFKHFVSGFTYATTEMTDPSDPETHERDGEFVICTREDSDWWDTYIRQFAFLTLNQEDKLEVPEIFDLREEPEDEHPGVDGLLVLDLSSDSRPFRYAGRRYPLYLVMVIQGSEIDYFDEHGGEALRDLLVQKAVYPFSEQYRPSVVP